MMPVTIANSITVDGDANDRPRTDAHAICTCGENINLEAGVNVSFFEPVRTARVVRHPWCSPSLGGVDHAGPQAAHHGRSGRDQDAGNTHFYQVHWLTSPWLFLLEAITDTHCLRQAPWDLVYFSELDPLWDDNIASFLLTPDAALFGRPASVLACAADCTAASVGRPIESLYWCSGCQGTLYPLTGWTRSSASPVASWILLSQRFATKLAREGLLWSAHGKRGQCQPYMQPIPRKDVWKTQLIYPARVTDNTGGKKCCQYFGAPTQTYDAFKSFAPGGEDGVVTLWRYRDCCMTKKMTDFVL